MQNCSFQHEDLKDDDVLLDLQVMKRTAKLFVIGLVTQGSSFPALGNTGGSLCSASSFTRSRHPFTRCVAPNTGIDLKRVRIPGILQRIAWAYLVTALIALYVPQVTLRTLSCTPSLQYSSFLCVAHMEIVAPHLIMLSSFK
jgi:hypothetical protein